MGPLLVKMSIEAFSLGGRLPRGQFFVLCLLLLTAQVPVVYLLASTTGSPAVFSLMFNISLFFESILLTVFICASIRRIRDAGGSTWLCFGFIAAMALFVSESLYAATIGGLTGAKDTEVISSLALWSCLGFGGCLFIMALMPSIPTIEDFNDVV